MYIYIFFFNYIMDIGFSLCSNEPQLSTATRDINSKHKENELYYVTMCNISSVF